MVNDSEIRSFVVDFLKNLGSEFDIREDVITVSKVPKDFEDFVGKKAPYIFVFDKEKFVADSEIMTKGSYMLKAMMSYLSEKGQTTLLKLNFDFDARELFQKKYSFDNCEICSISKDEDYVPFLRFTFLTTFQYLNEKEQVMNEIYADESGVIDFQIEKHQVIEGKKEDVRVKDVKSFYSAARERLKEKISKNIEKLGESLGKKLDKEIGRIKEHYRHQLSELDERKNKNLEQIKEIEAHLEKENVKDPDSLRAKIEKLKESNLSLENSEEKEKLRKEEEFFINDETRKHSLNIDNKMMNTSIIYYPIFNLKAMLLSKGTRRSLELTYNPLIPKLQNIMCEKCGKELEKISLCSFGHLTCKGCISKCGSCGKDYCKSCLEKKCTICGKEMCRKCSVKCTKCEKYVCLEHSKKSVYGTTCLSCLRKCLSCQNFFPKEAFVNCPNCGKEICGRCSTTQLIRSEGKVLCKSCAQICKFCGKAQTMDKFRRCKECKTESCNYPGKCLECRKQLCPKTKKFLSET